MGRVLKCGKEIELTGIPLLRSPQLTERGVMREGGNEGEREKRGRGRKREDILQGKAVIYEQATSNKQGEGDTPSPIKPGEVEGGEEKSQSDLKRELQ